MSLLVPVSQAPLVPPSAPDAVEPAAPDRASTLLGWTALAAILVVGAPVFLCMPLNFDTFHYDICARNLLRGGVHYRDAFDNNLPGVVWLQAGIRWLVGWRSESLHAVDLAFFSVGVVLLVRWVQPGARVWTAAALFAYYLFLPESCICQRDVWMMFPCLVGLTLRAVQVRRLLLPAPSALSVGCAAVLEGLIWGAAVWIKPFVFVPGLACWLVSVLQVRRARTVGVGPLVGDFLGLLAGGLLVCALGLACLWVSGSWPYFLDIFLGWNRDYAGITYRPEIRVSSLLGVLIWYLPWSIAPIAAAVVAVKALRRELVARAPAADQARANRPGVALLAAFLLGWLVQAVFLQFPHDYSLVPSIIPSLALLGAQYQWRRLSPAWSTLRMCALALMALLWTLAYQLDRVALWARCFREGSTPQLKSLLVMRKESAYAVDSAALADVEAFLVRQGAGDGEVTCMSGCTHPLYLDLNLKPSTRYSQVEMTALFFSKHRDVVLAELNASRQRFIVADLTWTGMTPKEAAEADPNDPSALPSEFPDKFALMYPWYEPMVFRSGRYLVYRATGPAVRFWREDVGVPDSKNDYAEEFADRQSFRDVTAAEATAAALEALYRRSEAAGDPAGRHEALRRGLTLLDRARAAGKDAEADVLRRWLEQKLDAPAAAGP